MSARFPWLFVAALVGCGGVVGAPGAFSTASEESSSTGGDDADGSTGGSIEPGAWEARAKMPSPRQDAGVAAIGNRVYVVGGVGAAGPDSTTDAVDAYDVGLDEWSAMPPLPVPMSHANVTALGDTLWVTGYLTGAGLNAHGDVFSWSMGDPTWQSRTPMVEARVRGASATVAEAGQVWVFGGLRDGSPVPDASTYRVQENDWIELPPLPAARDHLAGGAVEGKLYVVGGRTSEPQTHADDVWVFDPKLEEWSALASAPTRRSGAAAATHEGLLYVFGGAGNPDLMTGVFAATEVYDPVAGSWQMRPDMPTPRHAASAATVDHLVFVPGGADTVDFGPVATNEAWFIFD